MECLLRYHSALFTVGNYQNPDYTIDILYIYIMRA